MIHLKDNYEFDEEYIELDSEAVGHLVSVSFFQGEITMFCEKARCDNGELKFSELDQNDYLLFVEMDEKIAKKKFTGEDSTINRFELIDEDQEVKDDFSNVCDECSQCIGCDEHCGRGNHDEEFDTETKEFEDQCDCSECISNEEEELIGDLLELITDDNVNLEYLYEKSIQILYEFKDLGRRELKQEMRDYLE